MRSNQPEARYSDSLLGLPSPPTIGGRGRNRNSISSGKDDDEDEDEQRIETGDKTMLEDRPSRCHISQQTKSQTGAATIPDT